ncbi:anti-sigma factor RsbA family regulatory protein [Dactylosporangium sp. AC04546]|uniref:anti-sigma factor RsbA family regulatory protein n=1 Tax=Dactylosporangium sp. AC04546 TaxID=2862460 RepID=UPI001EDDF4B9|nr:anti-sigma factor RsbA family regulatory protein [Dactylosporangium sp. AC04546]WVK81841.1 anti-sigma factor RsbA family regulatory protein [Dactylosporangium sp. AC04546]
MRTGAAAGHTGYFHEAVVYDSDADLLAVAVPFVLDGVAAGEPTVIAFGARTAGLVRDAVGTAGVDFLTGGTAYGRPAGAIRAYRQLLAGHVAGGATQIRLLGELPEAVFGRTWDWWARYEATVNHAYDEFPLWSLCAYDARLAPRAVIDDVERTHPRLATTDGRHLDSGLFVDPVGYLRTPREDEDDPLQRRHPDIAHENPSPAAARQAVRAVAGGQGFREEQLEGLVIAVSEVVTNALRHGRPPVGLRVWGGGGRVVVQVTDRGDGPDNPYAGLLPSTQQQIGGLGLWITYQSCDHVRASRTPEGFAVTLTVG